MLLLLFFVCVVVVDPRNLPLKFGQNLGSNSIDIIVVVVIFFYVVVVVLVHFVAVDPRNLPLKLDVEFPVVVGGGLWRWWWRCKVILVSNPTFVMLG